MPYQFDDDLHDNILSMGIEQARLVQRYSVQYTNGTCDRGMPENGSTFLLLNIKVTNIGHQSSTTKYKSYGPDVAKFRVFFGGYNYTPETVKGEIISGTYRWDPYSKILLDRYEFVWGALLFEVPEDIDLSHTYLQVDLGEGVKPIWKLK
jgi:hypothetical protein